MLLDSAKVRHVDVMYLFVGCHVMSLLLRGKMEIEREREIAIEREREKVVC